SRSHGGRRRSRALRRRRSLGKRPDRQAQHCRGRDSDKGLRCFDSDRRVHGVAFWSSSLSVLSWTKFCASTRPTPIAGSLVTNESPKVRLRYRLRISRPTVRSCAFLARQLLVLALNAVASPSNLARSASLVRATVAASS